MLAGVCKDAGIAAALQQHIVALQQHQGNGTRMEGKHDANLTPSFCESRVVPVIGVHVGLIRASASRGL